MRCLDRIKDRMNYKPLDIEKLIKEGMINIKPGTPITCNVETKRSVSYIRVGQLNGKKIEGVGRLFYMTNCKDNAPKEWDMAHLSEGQYDGARSGFGRYFEDKDYYNAGWYAKGMFNGYVIDH